MFICALLSHIFQYYLVEEIWLLYLHSSMNSIFCFHNIVQWTTLNCDFPFFQNQFLHLCHTHISLWYAGLTSLIVIMLVQSSIVKLYTLFSDKLCCKCAINSVSLWWILWGEICFAHRNWFTFMNFFVLSSFQCHCHGIAAFLQYSTWLTDWLIDWLTDRPTDRPTDRLTDQLTYWLTDRLTLAACFASYPPTNAASYPKKNALFTQKLVARES